MSLAEFLDHPLVNFMAGALLMLFVVWLEGRPRDRDG